MRVGAAILVLLELGPEHHLARLDRTGRLVLLAVHALHDLAGTEIGFLKTHDHLVAVRVGLRLRRLPAGAVRVGSRLRAAEAAGRRSRSRLQADGDAVALADVAGLDGQ